jgi:hypothetical protein
MKARNKGAINKLTCDDCTQRLSEIEKYRALANACYQKEVKTLKGIHGAGRQFDEFKDTGKYIIARSKFTAILEAYFKENNDILEFSYRFWAKPYKYNMAGLMDAFNLYLKFVKTGLLCRLDVLRKRDELEAGNVSN